MKTLLLLACAIATAQNVELVPLTDAETGKLKALDVEVKRTEAIYMAASKNWLDANDKFCAALNGIKTARKLKETHGQCGNGGWSNELSSTSGTIMSDRYGTWEVDSTMKFLVHK